MKEKRWPRAARILAGAMGALIVVEPVLAASAPETGSAPMIMRSLIPVNVSAFDPVENRIQIPPPYGPPQGRMDHGLESFLDGRRSFAFLSREISEEDLAAFRAHHGGRDPWLVPIAQGRWNRFGYADAVVIIVNRSNPIRFLSFAQIDAIFSQSRLRGAGKIERWADLSSDLGELGSRKLDVAGSDAWTGVESARALTVRRRILSVGSRRGAWRRDVASGAEADVVARVGEDPAAIGFTGMGHLSAQVRVVPIGPNRRSAVEPTDAAARDGAYPLLRTIDLLVSPRLPKPVLCRFAAFLLSRRGQALIARQGDFAPLSPEARRRARIHARALSCSRQY